MSTDVAGDFDRIASLADCGESGRTRYDGFLLSLVPASAREILEVGSGLGRFTARLARSDRHVTGLDLSPEMVRRAQGRCGEANVTFVCADFMVWTPDQAFDCIVSAATLHHMPAGPALSRMMQLLRPGGRLIVHDLRAPTGPFDYVKAGMALTAEALRRLVTRGALRSPRAVRDAWASHAATDHYLTRDEVRTMAGDQLGDGYRYIDHWLARYTIVWDKPAG